MAGTQKMTSEFNHFSLSLCNTLSASTIKSHTHTLDLNWMTVLRAQQAECARGEQCHILPTPLAHSFIYLERQQRSRVSVLCLRVSRTDSDWTLKGSFIVTGFEWAVCPAALLPELQPAPCFLSAIIGQID